MSAAVHFVVAGPRPFVMLARPSARAIVRTRPFLAGLGDISSSAVSTIADTIQKIEGWYPGTLAWRNNNPGNLIYVGQSGAVPGEGGFARFPSYEAGREALESQIGRYASRGLTLDSMMAIYAPAGHGGNDPSGYARSIAAALGVDSSAALADLGDTSGSSSWFSDSQIIPFPDLAGGSGASPAGSDTSALPPWAWGLLALGLVGWAVS